MPRAATTSRRSTARSTLPETPPAPPAGFAPLDQSQIEAQTDPGSFDRGKSYYRTGKIFDAVRRGTTLGARCRGSSGGPYRVEAVLAASDQGSRANPSAFGCDCPRGGFCKHVVALLLTWVHLPDTFEVRPPVSELLAAKSREELVALVVLLLGEAPELEDLIALPMPVALPGECADLDAPVDEAAIRRLVAAAVDFDDDGVGERGWGYDAYHDGYGSGVDAEQLDRLSALARAYGDAGRWRHALAVGATLVEQIAPGFDETLLDEGGGLAAVLASCDRVLAEALTAQEQLPSDRRLSPEERERLITALVDLWEADTIAGGQGLCEEGPAAIARHATAEEQRQVGQRLRATIKPRSEFDHGREWLNRGAIGFLARLAGEAGLSDDESLAEYQAAELWEDAAAILLRAGRVEEAIALAARRLDEMIALLQFADRLVAAGEPHRQEQALSLVDGRLWEREGRDVRHDLLALEWLQRRHADAGHAATALDAARRRFKLLPSKSTYDAVYAAASLPGQDDALWPKLSLGLLKTLRSRGDWVALIDAHLEAGDVAAALAIVKERLRAKPGEHLSPTGWSYGWSSDFAGPEERVANAAEDDFPDDAIAIYRALADRQIEGRQRPAYRRAAELLAKVKALMTAAGQTDDWQTLIADLRAEHKRLRALREELNAFDLR